MLEFFDHINFHLYYWNSRISLMLLYIGSSSGFGISKCFISIVPFTIRGNVEFLIVLMKELMVIFISVWIIKLHIEAIIFNEWNIITFVVLLIRFIVFLHSIGILVFICNKFCKSGLHLNPNDINLKVIKDIHIFFAKQGQ